MSKIYIILLRIRVVATLPGGPARMLRSGFYYVGDSRAGLSGSYDPRDEIGAGQTTFVFLHPNYELNTVMREMT
jgi:hypothetical protein